MGKCVNTSTSKGDKTTEIPQRPGHLSIYACENIKLCRDKHIEPNFVWNYMLSFPTPGCKFSPLPHFGSITACQNCYCSVIYRPVSLTEESSSVLTLGSLVCSSLLTGTRAICIYSLFLYIQSVTVLNIKQSVLFQWTKQLTSSVGNESRSKERDQMWKKIEGESMF